MNPPPGGRSGQGRQGFRKSQIIAPPGSVGSSLLSTPPGGEAAADPGEQAAAFRPNALCKDRQCGREPGAVVSS